MNQVEAQVTGHLLAYFGVILAGLIVAVVEFWIYLRPAILKDE